MNVNRYNLSFGFLLLANFLILLYCANNFSISAAEADIYFNSTNSLLYYITNLSTSIFGQNDITLRLPFILFYLGSSVLLYLLTDDYFKKKVDRIIALSIFMILPGIYSAALLVNEAIIVVFCTLLYLYLYKLTNKEHYILLIVYLFIDNSFAILYLALFFYSLRKKDNVLLIVSLTLFGFSMSMYGFDIGGRPKGYFLDTFGIYASIFSPILFLYFFYSLYRVGLKYDKDLYWYISITALGLSLLFSFRQRVNIEDFAPFVVISVPIMVKLFMHSLRIRLKIFRLKYYIIAYISIGILILNILVFVFNKYLYIFLDNPQKHFAYKYHIVKELAQNLKKENIYEVYSYDKTLQNRLKFYDIKSLSKYILSDKTNKNCRKIDIKYFNIVVKSYCIKNSI